MTTFKVLKLFPIDLQRFAGEDSDADTMEDVVDLPDEELADGEDVTELDEDPEVVEPEDGQTPEENAAFKKMRLKAEAEAAKKFEAQAQKIAQEKQALALQRQELEQKAAERKVYDEMLSDDAIWRRAEDEGVSEEVARKMIMAEAKSIVESEKLKVRARFEALEHQKKALAGQKYFKELEAEVDAIVAANPAIDVQTAFHYLRSQKLDELEKKNSSNIEKKTIADIQDRMKRKTTPSGGGQVVRVEPSKVMSREDIEMSRAFGHDPRDIAEHVYKNLKRK